MKSITKMEYLIPNFFKEIYFVNTLAHFKIFITLCNEYTAFIFLTVIITVKYLVIHLTRGGAVW